ncbi:hypothetical protein [Hymenobacter sp.]|uniref:hypothetical protein n=1 Tax=Hymenobacter sp. TaxID=1898978 RepID=UPI002EDA851A
MNTRYSPAATRGNDAATTSTALVRIPRAARHQLWHLTNPLLPTLPGLLPGAAHALTAPPA